MKVTNSHKVNTAIHNLLLAGEVEHVRYFDLFSNYYFKNNRDKREIAARRYTLLKTCNELTESKAYSIKEVFEVYQGFKSASIKNYQSFCNKLKEFRQSNVSTCIHKRIGNEYKDRYKLNPYVENLIYIYLGNPNYSSYNLVKELVNQSILKYNEVHGKNFKAISVGTIAKYYLKNRNEINCHRGKRELI